MPLQFELCRTLQRGAKAFVAVIFLLSAALPAKTLKIPAGTAIPVRFPHTLDARKLHAGALISAETMQLVFVGPAAIIPKGTRVTGQVIAASYSGKGEPSSLELRFDHLNFHGDSQPVCLSLRALASLNEVYNAKTPASTMDANPDLGTTLVGGDKIQLGSNKVFTSDGSDQVGIQNRDGIFSRLEPPLLGATSGGSTCDGISTLQSVAVFSSRACGLYGFPGIQWVPMPEAPQPEILLTSDHEPVLIHSGSAALLQVTSCGARQL